MGTTTRDEHDRTNGRFVRNLALSLSGGALIALVGASAAHAQDASTAGTNSTGLGATGTGDATAVGNHSGSNTTQGGTISGAQGSVQVITQTGGINNNGVAVANTGGNRATGNDSHNTANATQNALSGAGGAVNNGQAANGSDGVAFITTGNASAVGNQSTTNLNQTISARGALGGILVLTQDSTVTNSGRAFAGTGANTAEGNGTRNEADLKSTLNLLNGLGANSGKATNSSDGHATIATGNASAMGNVSDTSVTQSSNGAAGGDGMGGGLVLIPQSTEVLNDGRAEATTGDNEAEGNESTNGSDTTQTIGSTGNEFFADTGVAANNGEASNWSGGTASIRTGNASAVGNHSSSNVSQTAESDLTKTGGLSVLVQDPTIVNFGRAEANTGDNDATGNESRSEFLKSADVFQNVPSTGTGVVESGVVSNSAEASNSSDGTATVATGDASATGNWSTTTTSQSSTADHNNLNVFPQSETVANIGIASANTGDNSATGNESRNEVTVAQGDTLPTAPTGLENAVISNSAKASDSSDGTASVTTGSASAAGNESSTTLSQEIDPTGLVLPVQAAVVVNAGVGVADTGNNEAEGNASINQVQLAQTVNLGSGNGGTTDIDAGLVVGANQGEASNSSDGRASVTTGAASALGNHSDTWIGQSSTGSVDGLGLVVNTQAAAVANLGAGTAETGQNDAQGNESTNGGGDNSLSQTASVGSGDVGGAEINAGIITASNSGSASNSSDGAASIETGAADATGNRSRTKIGQTEGASVGGIGGVINTQAAVVGNVGLGAANTGGNNAIGNTSSSVDSADQFARVGADDLGGAVEINAPIVTAANSASVSNSSDGTADVSTGSASATGNASSTDITQDPGSSVDGLGLVVNTQVAAVANIGIGVANSGGNLAVGNASNNENNDATPGAAAGQSADIGSGNSANVGTTDVTSFGPMIAANQADVSNSSDGTGRVRTGNAQARGNTSTTTIDQSESGAVDGLGVTIDTQVAGVANVGVAVANSGLNAAVGNVSDNGGIVPVGQVGLTPGASVTQDAEIGSDNTGGSVDLTGVGPMAASNSAQVGNSSDGTGQVGTGNATASGNTSATTINQRQSADVTDMGLIVNTQAAGVANVGIGVANSGLNAAVGNASGFLDPTGGGPGSGTPNVATTTQSAELISSTGTPTEPVTVLGPATATNQGEATNSSDGNACVCTGNATASGNISTTTLNQSLDTSVATGVAVLTEAGGVLNAGVGIANSGLNLALGNISQNLATAKQVNTDNAGLVGAPGGVVGPQTVNSGGGATNDSNGTGKVGTGNATATGNESTTGFTQAATSDSDLAISTLAAGTTNTGLGLANSGVNLGVGNASVNEAHLMQTADGAGIVSSVGTASNESDGSGLVGNPNCNVPGTPTTTPGQPGTATLPHTGAPIEVEAAVGLMLLLAGFGLRRKSASLS